MLITAYEHVLQLNWTEQLPPSQVCVM